MASLLDSHAQAWVDNWEEMNVFEPGDKKDFVDLASLLQELQDFRARTCGACFWRIAKTNHCRVVYISAHPMMVNKDTAGCAVWQAKEDKDV